MNRSLLMTVAVVIAIALAGCTFHPVRPVATLTAEAAAGVPAPTTPTPTPAEEAAVAGAATPAAEEETTGTATPAAEAETAAGTPTAAAEEETVTATPAVEEEPAAASAEDVAQQVRDFIAQQTGLAVDQVTIVSTEAVEWPDACLGVTNPDEMCAAVITPGFLVVVDTPNGTFEVHTDASGNSIRIASAPAADVGDVLIEWRQTAESCRSAVVGWDRVAVGPCGGVQVAGTLANPDRAAELLELLTTYASFEGDTPAGSVVFHGVGMQPAQAAEQRMIAEWMRLLALEAESGHGGATRGSLGQAFAWHREGGIAGFCDDLTVYVTGQAYAESCKQDPPATLAKRRLSADELTQVYDWVDSFARWEYREGDLGPADGMLVTLTFSGAGDLTPTESEQQAVVSFAQDLWTAMTQ